MNYFFMRNSDVVVRELRADDSKTEIKHLFAQLSSRDIDPEVEALAADSDCHVIVAEQDGKLVGISSIVFYRTPTRGRVGRVEDVVVDESARGQGLGRRMMEILVDEARKREVACVQLDSEPYRPSARKLYDSLGFSMRETGEFVLWL